MTTLREAATQALEALESAEFDPHSSDAVYKAITALRAALAEYDKDRVKVEEMKANWALQRKLAEETQERDRQQREYEEQRLAALVEDAMQKFTDVNQELEAALAEPVQEPVAWRWGYRSITTGEMDWRGYVDMAAHPNLRSPAITEPLYTAPPQRNPLTEEEALDIARTFGAQPWPPGSCVAFARAIERAHGIGGQP